MLGMDREGNEVPASTVKKMATVKTVVAKKKVTGKPLSTKPLALAQKPGASTKKPSKRVDILELFVRTYSSF